MAVLKQIKFGTSTTPIAKTVVNGTGVVSVTNTEGFSNKETEEKDYSYDIDVNVDDSTIKKSDGKLTVGNVPAAQVTVDNTAAGITSTNAQAAFKELKDSINAVGGAAKSYTIIKETSKTPGVTLEANVLEQYKLQQTVNNVTSIKGETIKIYKDSSLKSVALDGQTLNFTYILADGSESTVGVDVSTFLAESEFADGLQVTNHIVSVKLGQGLEFGNEAEHKSIKVKIDSASESFLTVGDNGVKLTGVQDAINAKVAALDVTDDKAVEGQYVAAIQETDGIVSVKERKNVSEALLNNYAKGSEDTAVAASDTINQAISKLENQVDAAKAATTAAIEALDVTDAAVEGQYVSQVSETDGKIAVSRLNVSDAVLNGYAKGEKPTSTAIDATDDVKGALAKLEHQVDAAKAAATTKVVKGTDAGNNMEIVPTKSEDDGSTTYTINLTDVASKAALDAEIAARKLVDGQSGDTYGANGNTNYISDATSLNDADVKLDTALKAEANRAQDAENEIAEKVGLTGNEGARTFTPTTNYGADSTSVVGNMQKLDTKLKEVADGLAAVQYKVNGTTLEFFGISLKTV